MPFPRFFGRGRETPAPAEQPSVETELASGAANDDGEVDTLSDDAAPESSDARSWRERAEAVMPTGAYSFTMC